ncbi:MAG: protein-glutamate methylesterase/protein-glutamine glutaminase, partial [Halothiobacillaceae bacterium]
MSEQQPIRVLVVDDSMLIRKALARALAEDPELHVVGAAKDAYEARELIKALEPDVITLDVEMPGMSGLTFLRNLMRLHPMPVVMVSTHTRQGAYATLEALELGAFDVVAKPTTGGGLAVQDYVQEIVAKVKAAARAPVRRVAHQRLLGGMQARPLSAGAGSKLADANRLIAIGASTGGTEAVKVILEGLPPEIPGVVITQHIPGSFSATFAERLNQVSRLQVKEAEDGELIKPGHAYVAPGTQHLLVTRSGGALRCILSDAPPVSKHKPSVDVLFDSVAKAVGAGAVGVLLTGMGKDGAEGLLHMRQAGAITIIQDEQTSVVWGMPGEAYRLGAAERVVPLPKMA